MRRARRRGRERAPRPRAAAASPTGSPRCARPSKRPACCSRSTRSGRAVDLSPPAVESRFATLRVEVDSGRARLADACARGAAARARRPPLRGALDHAGGSAAPLRHALLRRGAAGGADRRSHDDREAVDSEWRAPGAMRSPLRRGRARDAAAHRRHAAHPRGLLARGGRGRRRGGARGRARTGRARSTGDGGSWRVLLPGDADYETAPARSCRPGCACVRQRRSAAARPRAEWDGSRARSRS